MDNPLRWESRDMRSGEWFMLDVFDEVTGKHIGSASVSRRPDMAPNTFDRLRMRLEPSDER